MEVLDVIRKKSRAAAYCRFSSSNQREESIDAQLRAIYKFMGEHDYTPVGDYIDMALTGTNTDRPNFQRMIEDAKKGLFDVVIVHKMDRFSRNVRDTLNIESELAQYGVKVISVIEQFADTPEATITANHPIRCRSILFPEFSKRSNERIERECV